MKHAGWILTCLLAAAGKVSADDPPVRITRDFTEGERCELRIQILNGQGEPDSPARHTLPPVGRMEPSFGSSPPGPAMFDATSASWSWKNLPPGLYELRFLVDHGLWVVAPSLVRGERTTIRLRRPSTLWAKGTVSTTQEPLHDAIVSAVSHLAHTQDRILWKTWTGTDETGSYRLSLLPQADVQTFLDDPEPTSLPLQGRSERFVIPWQSRWILAGRELWSRRLAADDPQEGDIDIGTASAPILGASLRIRCRSSLSRPIVQVFAKTREHFSFHFTEATHGRPLLWTRIGEIRRATGAELNLDRLPEGEALVVISDGSQRTFVLHRLVQLQAGRTTSLAADFPPSADGGRVIGILHGLRPDGEAEYARIRRVLHILPSNLADACGSELAEAFGFPLPWKGEEREILEVPAGEYAVWISRGTWLNTTLLPPEAQRSIPLDMIFRALQQKLVQEEIQPPYRKIVVLPEKRTVVSFVVRQRNP